MFRMTRISAAMLLIMATIFYQAPFSELYAQGGPPPTGLLGMPPSLFVAPGDSVGIPVEVFAPVPADSQVSGFAMTIRRSSSDFTFLTADTVTTKLHDWIFSVIIAGDSVRVEANSPDTTFFVKADGPPALLFKLVGSLSSGFAPGDSMELKLKNVSVVSKGVVVAFPDSDFVPTRILAGAPPPPPPPPPPGGSFKLFSFLDTISQPDSVFILDFALLKSVPPDSELSRIRAVIKGVPPLLEWATDGHLVAPELSGWTLTATAGDDSLAFDLKAPTDSFLVHSDPKPLVLVSLTGNVKAAAPVDAIIDVETDKIFLTQHGTEVEIDTNQVQSGKVILEDSSGTGLPPPPPPPPTATTDGRSNLGLYGGSVLDMAFDEVHGIMLAAVASPQSVFMSSDSGLTWAAAFPTDSLEFLTDFHLRGFGGRATHVESSEGYSYARNNQEAGTLTGSQVTEDGVNWRTLLDQYLANKLLEDAFGSAVGQGPRAVQAISAHGAVALVAIGNFVFRTTDAGQTWDISVLPDASALSENRMVKALDIHRDDPTGMGFYAMMSESFDKPGDAFYRTEDGTNFERIYVFSGTDTAEVIRAFASHPLASDSLWATALSLSNPGFSGVWRSYDAGASWTQVLVPNNPMMAPAVTIYQDPGFPGPDNIRLFLVGEDKYSDDLGDTWTDFTPQNDPFVQRVSAANVGIGHIPNTDIYFSQGDGAPARSITGLNGNFEFVPTGIEGITIWDIAQVPDEMDKVYLATSVGIAYTSKFTDTTITATAKWYNPHGNYPINPNGGGNTGFTAIEIDPNNTSHIVAANGNAIFVAESGGFTNDTWSSIPYNQISGFDEMTFKGKGGRVGQFAFITSDSIIAAAYTEHVLYGTLILSTDGGQTWETMPQAGNHNYKTVAAAWNTAKDSLVLFAAGGAIVSDPGGHSTAIDSGALYKSLDWGASWSRIAVTPNGTFNPAPFPLPVNEIMIKPGSLDTLYMACGENLSNAIVRTFDGGSTLESISMQAIGPREGAFEAVAINKNHPDSIYFAIRRDILVYDAISNTATTLFRGYPGELTHALLYDELTMGSSAGFYSVDAPQAITTSVEEIPTPIPNSVVLAQNYPNPFNPSTNIRFELSTDASVKLEIFNILGQRVEVLLADRRKAGKHTVFWRPQDLASGVYFYRLRVTFKNGHEQILSRKLMFLK